MNNFRKIPMWVHGIIIGIILLIVAFSVYKLLKWNEGTAEIQGPDGESYEIEVEDQVFLLPEDKRAGHEDDGQETILFLGNDSITYDQKETGVAGQVAKKLGANCINAGFPESTVALRSPVYTDDYPLDAFSFVNVVNSIVSGDFSQMESAAPSFSDYTYQEHTGVLKELDMNKVDTLVIYYNAQDYLSLRFGMNPGDENDPITYSGALNSGIKAIQEKYPFIRIVCMSFTMCYAFDKTGALVSGDRYDFGNGRLTTYRQFMIDVSGATGVTFIDNYYGTIHEDNSSEWLLDHIHVNADCNAYVADHFVRVVYP
jgi:hypothetical protein